MGQMFAAKDYQWALFAGHLVIEELLKAYYVKNVDDYPPLNHVLLPLAEGMGLELTEEQRDFLATVTTFFVHSRYDDFKYAFHKCDKKEFTETWIGKITEFRKWIKGQLLNSQKAISHS